MSLGAVNVKLERRGVPRPPADAHFPKVSTLGMRDGEEVAIGTKPHLRPGTLQSGRRLNFMYNPIVGQVPNEDQRTLGVIHRITFARRIKLRYIWDPYLRPVPQLFGEINSPQTACRFIAQRKNLLR